MHSFVPESAQADGRSWLQRLGDEVHAHALQHKRPDEPIVCASGISPSGSIHLGNLREVMTVHLVAEELRSRGLRVEHIHSWDDFDRFRKVPAGLPDSLSAYIGRPLARVPDPYGEYASYADRFITEFVDGLTRLGVHPRFVRQSVAYRRGDYTEQIRTAIERRFEIFDILASFQTPGRHTDDADTRRESYFPFRPFCANCDRDATAVVSYDARTDLMEYDCHACHTHHVISLGATPLEGKLVWKVDWPMRWWFERVDFEPGGEDHSSPQGSFAAGRRIVREIFGGVEPYYVGYAFVGLSGEATKMSSSGGLVATPATALKVIEPGLLRWLYVRRRPDQAFSIDLGGAIQRLYDEWDQLLDRNHDGPATAADRHLVSLATTSSTGAVELTAARVPFRVLASAADLTQGNREQVIRIAAQHLAGPVATGAVASQLEPRLRCAIGWALEFLPEAERTTVRTAFDTDTWAALSPRVRDGVVLTLHRLDAAWTLEGLTKLLYGVPKQLFGLSEDAPADASVKKAQREFFVGLYQLLCGSDTGPRLPTLFLSLGAPRVRALLTAPPS